MYTEKNNAQLFFIEWMIMAAWDRLYRCIGCKAEPAGEAAGAGRLTPEQDKPGNGASRYTWCGRVE
jgi:hypothetical protein